MNILKNLQICDHKSDNLLYISGIGLLGVGIPLIIGGYMFGGAVHSPFQTIFSKPEYIVKGTVEEGYEKVKEVFEMIIKDGMEEHAQVCAFVDGKVVVNLVGVAHKEREKHPKSYLPYSTDSIQNIFSSTKAITSIVVAMLVHQGRLRYDMPISEIWPEFAQLDKHVITLEELLKHESGMEKFSFSIAANQLHRESIKAGTVGRMIAETTTNRLPNQEPERSYHYLTRDIILNEIIRRADSQGRTVGEIVRDDIARPLGLQDQLTIGTETLEQQHKLFPLVRKNPLWIFLHIFNFISRKVSILSCIAHLALMHSDSLVTLAKLFFSTIPKPSIVLGHGESDFLYMDEMFNNTLVRAAEIPSANGHASAYALAKVASVMAAKGTAHNVTLLSEETFHIATGNITEKYDKAVKFTTRFARGGWCHFSSPFAFGNYRHGCMGWFGIGGSAIQWHSELNVGFGYVPTLLGAELGNKHSALLQDALLRCVQNLKGN